MPTTIGEKYDLSYTGVPPMMSPKDFEIWKRYLPDIPENYEGVYYNVHVGNGLPIPTNLPQKYKDFWLEKTQLRIDALVVFKDKVWIIEIRDSARSDALGRLLAYDMLYRDDNVFGLPVSLTLVTDFYISDLARLAAELGIIYIVT